MSRFIIQGGHELSGRVSVSGSKNAALAVLSATILASEPCEIENVPDILDVRVFLMILEHLGARIEFANHKAIVDPRNISSKSVPAKLMSKLRGSILLAGPLLARFGHVSLVKPGGDAIGSRPIDVHLTGFAKLGAVVSENDIIEISGKLKGAKIVLSVTSVTGTENLIMAASLAQGDTEIRMAATEPHVQNLCNFLNAMGAKIEGVGTPTLRVTGQNRLSGAKFRIGSDEIEAITFCAAAAATKSEIEITGVDLDHLDAPLATLERMNVRFTIEPGKLRILKPDKDLSGTKITTGVYPQLLTDEQPLLGVLATQAHGETTIHDWIYEGRQGYLVALQQMGATVILEDKNHAKITGPTPLHGAEIKTPDLRAGASILIAALVARGESVIYNAEIIDRGYERLDERLRDLGADIKRVE